MNKPEDISMHYATAIQPIDVMKANMSPEAYKGFLRGNIIKYACRMDKKGQELSDARKMIVYANWLAEQIGDERAENEGHNTER